MNQGAAMTNGTIFARLGGAFLLICGGGLTALGTALGVYIMTSYLEWDAALTAAPLVMLISLIPVLTGAGLMAIGGWLRARDGLTTARKGLSIWMLAIGTTLILSPAFNLLWSIIRGSSFTTPGFPLTPYIAAMLCGLALIWAMIWLGRTSLSKRT